MLYFIMLAGSSDFTEKVSSAPLWCAKLAPQFLGDDYTIAQRKSYHKAGKV
jgi:hypothetical protein